MQLDSLWRVSIVECILAVDYLRSGTKQGLLDTLPLRDSGDFTTTSSDITRIQ